MAVSVVVTRIPGGTALDRLTSEFDVWAWEEDRAIPPEDLLERVATAAGLYCMLTEPIDQRLLDAAPSLVAISQMAVGVDNIDVEACTARGIPVGHTPDVLTETTADTAMALLAASVRRVDEGSRFVRKGRWQRWEPGLLLGGDLHGTTLGIVGLGRIGRAVARRAAGFGMRILYTGPVPKPDTDLEFLDLEGLLADSDHVVITAPLNESTRYLFDAGALAKMKPTASLVNVSRGPIVDSEALYVALRDGVIARAALDVTDPEPIPPDDPLLSLDNCLVIPHLGSASRRTRAAMADLAADNLREALNGRPMRACVNPEVGNP
jgi:lactate dehydrogenase-like 2-hydroxyacid dehydrogenase